MTIWSAASSVTSCPALLSSSGSSKTHEQQRRPTKRVVPRPKVRDLVESSTDELSSRENLSKAPTSRLPKRYIPRYITNNASPLSITSRNTLNSNGVVSSNSNLSTLSKGSSFVTAIESDCLLRRAGGNNGQRLLSKDKIKAEGDLNQKVQKHFPTKQQQLHQQPTVNALKRTASNVSNLSKSTVGLLVLPRMSIESMTTNEMLHLAEEQTAISDKSPWHNAQTVLDGIVMDSPRRTARTKSLQSIKSFQTKIHPSERYERKIQFGKNILQFRAQARNEGMRNQTNYCKSITMPVGKRYGIRKSVATCNSRNSRLSTSTLDLYNNVLSNSNCREDNMKQAENVILTVLQILYFYGTFFLGFGLLLVAYYLHD